MENSRSRKLKYAVSAGLAKRRKNYSSFKFLLENLEKFRLTELNDAPLEGLTIFRYRTSFGPTTLESSRLGELKYANSAGYDVTLKNTSFRKCKKMTVRRTYMVTVVWATGGIDIFLSSRAPLDSSRLGEQKYAISKR